MDGYLGMAQGPAVCGSLLCHVQVQRLPPSSGVERTRTECVGSRLGPTRVRLYLHRRKIAPVESRPLRRRTRLVLSASRWAARRWRDDGLAARKEAAGDALTRRARRFKILEDPAIRAGCVLGQVGAVMLGPEDAQRFGTPSVELANELRAQIKALDASGQCFDRNILRVVSFEVDARNHSCGLSNARITPSYGN